MHRIRDMQIQTDPDPQNVDPAGSGSVMFRFCIALLTYINWNNLPEDVRASTTLQLFRRRLKSEQPKTYGHPQRCSCSDVG